MNILAFTDTIFPSYRNMLPQGPVRHDGKQKVLVQLVGFDLNGCYRSSNALSGFR